MANNRNRVEEAAYAVGLRVGTWHPGDGATRYRFFREDKPDVGGTYDYFGGSGALITVLGRKAALQFIEAYGMGRTAGIREARGDLFRFTPGGEMRAKAEEILDNLIERGPWHFGTTEEAANV